jgi:hypothetical protein
MSKLGIDYGMGKTNIDTTNGIRYGVISLHEVVQAWRDSSEPDYGDPHCPKCGNEAVGIDDPAVPDIDDLPTDEWEDDGRDHACLNCCYSFYSSDAHGDEPLSHTLDDGEYIASQGGGDSDIFIIKSPYYTTCNFCSPCAPGAGYLMNTVDDGIKAYCFGHDWFDDGKAPYPVYSVATGELVTV